MSHTHLSGPNGPAEIARRSESSGRSSQPVHSAGLDPARPGAGSRSSSASCSSKLRGLSDRELLSRVKDLVSRERAVTLEVLVHLIEVERRRLHVDLGYASMFDYCTRHLRYSSSAASRRIQSARCIRDYPEVFELIAENEVNLVTVSLIASVLTTENAKDLLGKIRGRSQREVEAIAATYRPPVSMRDRATPVCVAVPAQSAHALNLTKGEHTPSGGSNTASGSAAGPPAAAGSSGGALQATTMSQAQWQASSTFADAHASPRLETKFHVQFLAGERFMKKLEKAKALLSNRNGVLSYEAVLEAALDEFLHDRDPEERRKRRDDRREKAEERAKSGDRAGSGRVDGPLSSPERAGSGRADDSSCERDRAGGGQADGPLFRRRAGGLPATRVVRDRGLSRRIAAAVRDAVYARDKGRCTYVGPNGERCAATHHLQIDHVIPRARGGPNTFGNLRLLCERHNKKEAERVYGANVMRKFRARE